MRKLFIIPLVALFFIGVHIAWSPSDSGQTHYVNLAEAQTPLFSVTINDSIQWDAIPGAEFDVVVRNAPGGANMTPPGILSVGAANTVAVNALLPGQPLQNYFVLVRSKNPGGGGESDWSTAVEFALIGFPVPTGISKVP